MRAVPLILFTWLVPLTAFAEAEPLVLPSGASAQALPVIWDEDISAIRLRYLVKELEDASYAEDMERVFEDMAWLCETQILPLFAENGDPRTEGWEGVVVTMMDREVTFGVLDTGAIQMFEWFRLEESGCTHDWDSYHD